MADGTMMTPVIRHGLWSLALILGLSSLVSAGTLRATWNPSIGATRYTLYYGQTSGIYTVALDTGEATQAVVDGLHADATYYFAVTASNAERESAYSDEVWIRLRSPDTVAPVVAITSPADGTSVVRKGLVTIQAEASDNVGVVAVTMRVNGQALCTDQTVPYQCSWSVPAANNRRYQLTATAVDAAGNQGVSPVVEVTGE